MNKYHLTRGFGLVVLCAGLAACSTQHESNELTQKSVQYQCGAQADKALNLDVKYTFQGAEPVTAQVIYNNQAIDLTRDTNNKSDMVGNTFVGNGYSWTTGKFTYENADKVDGNMLVQDGQQTVNGKNTSVNNILAKDCKVNG